MENISQPKGNFMETVRQTKRNRLSPSLYVGNLTPDVTEKTLYEKFSQAGRLHTINVCRDRRTMRCLGHAYVCYLDYEDAKRALLTMNHDLVDGRPCRIMWELEDPSRLFSGVGNVFVKNLDSSIDNAFLHKKFSPFGNILSCKVARNNPDGSSYGYGYVQFENQESAELAIRRGNGMLVKNKKINVTRFIPRKNRFASFHAPKGSLANGRYACALYAQDASRGGPCSLHTVWPCRDAFS